MSSRDEFPELHEGDAIVAPDACKGKDWEDKIEKCMGSAVHMVNRHFIPYTHNSAEDRMQRDLGHVLDLMETALVISKSELSVIKRSRKHLSGQSARSNWLGPVDFASWTDTDKTWHLPFKTKKEIYGATNRPFPGGQCKVHHVQDERITNTLMVPAFSTSSPQSCQRRSPIP